MLSDSDNYSQFDDSDVDPNYSSNSSSTSSTNDDSEEERSVVESATHQAREPNNVAEATNTIVQKGRKRKANPEAWKKSVAKRCRNSGLEYTSSSKSKKVFKARNMGPPCNTKCRLQCSTKITQDDRKAIFSDYWNLSDLQRQRGFLLKSIETVTPKYQYKRVHSNRGNNHAFYFSIKGTKFRVCKMFFKSTLAITDRPIRTVIQKQTYNTEGMITPEQRGTHDHHYHVDDDVKNGVRSHINSIPRIESHYCRKDSSREYIEGGKTVAQLHRDYVGICKENNKPYANYLMYNRIFNEEFKIAFFIPKKDKCGDCVSYEIASAEEKKKLKVNYDTHLNEKELSRKEKEKDKEDKRDNVVVAVYDLQAVLQCPRGAVSTFYYVSKLNVFNFTIYELKSKAVKCFMWDESQANRGVCEIGTCVLKYLESLKEKASTTESKTLDVVFYSDNCCGQQKNHFMFALYLYAVQKYEYINSITHKFLIKGHTQNEGDSVHSVIEQQVKRALRSGPIFVPAQYMTLIRLAKTSGKPYEVYELNHENFFNLKDLASRIGTNFSKNINNESVKMSNFNIIKAEKEQPDKLFYKTSYSEEQFQTILVKRPRTSGKTRSSSNTDSDTTVIELQKLYSAKPGINEKKKTSILSLFTKNQQSVVPQYYCNYFQSL